MKTLEEIEKMPGIRIREDGIAEVALSPIPNWYNMIDFEKSKNPIECVRCGEKVKVFYPASRDMAITLPAAAKDAYIEPRECMKAIGHRYFTFECPQCKLVQIWHNFD